MVRRVGRWISVVSVLALSAGAWLVALTVPAGAVTVSTEAELQTAFANASETQIVLANNIDLTCGGGGDLDRNSATALTVDGNGFTIDQTCAGQRVMQQAGTGALTVENVTLTGGTAVGPGIPGIGGAIFTNGSVTITGATVTANSATDGAGGIFADGPVTVTGSTISGNTTADGGGGISTGPSGPVTVTDSTISDNHATGGSGGAIGAGASVTVTGSTISANTATGDGGGIITESSVTVTRSTISGNTADRGGGGMTSAGGSITVTDSTITGNTAGAFGGGGIRGAVSGSVTLVYATVVGNTATADAANIRQLQGVLTAFGSVVALPQGGIPNCFGATTTTSNGFNFSDDDSCGFTNVAQGDRENAGDPGLGPLADNGGPTQTRLPQTGSPLIDAIPTVSCQADGASGIATDQRGVSRPQGDGCDIGAVEVERAAPPTPPPPGPAAPTPAVLVRPRFTG